ncbi:MAG TPA: thiamine pyrophosphate-binding protein [Myxococcota bacterium]
MRVADVIASFLADRGARHVFMVTGGGAMHLNDAFGRHDGLRYICCHHEQACAMAAESYARLTGVPAVVNVTTGPGGINALNGVYGAYTDSVPMIVVSGQVKRETCMAFNDVPGLRQLGDQEADLVGMVRGITKFAELVREPADILRILEQAWHEATSGRPGPVWIDVPVDVQGANVDVDTLVGFTPPPSPLPEPREVASLAVETLERVRGARRPVVLVGGGIRAGGAHDALLRLLEQWHVPVVTAWNAHDVIWDEHPRYAGRPGTIGDRAGNFAVQNADVLLVIGSRLNIRQVGYAWKTFAKHAFKIQVDVDAAELRKPTVKPDLAVHADARTFIDALLAAGSVDATETRAAWIAQCHRWRATYPVVQDAQRHDDAPMNPYGFVEVLFRHLRDDDVVVCADGSACVVTFQAAALKRGQRLFTNSGSASMGYDLPAAIGAAVATGKRVICLAGDGSIQMNLQELQTIKTHRLPVKVIVIDNDGYHSIRQTQQNFFGALYGSTPGSGVEFPAMDKIAAAYGLASSSAVRLSELPAALAACFDTAGPAICTVQVDPKQPFSPKQSSRRLDDGSMVSAPLEDLAPFLDRDELAGNLFFNEGTT